MPPKTLKQALAEDKPKGSIPLPEIDVAGAISTAASDQGTRDRTPVATEEQLSKEADAIDAAAVQQREREEGIVRSEPAAFEHFGPNNPFILPKPKGRGRPADTLVQEVKGSPFEQASQEAMQQHLDGARLAYQKSAAMMLDNMGANLQDHKKLTSFLKEFPDEYEKEMDAALTDIDKQFSQLQEDVASINTQVRPGQLFSGAGQSLAAASAVGLSSFASALLGQGSGPSIIERAIQRDIDAQEKMIDAGMAKANVGIQLIDRARSLFNDKKTAREAIYSLHVNNTAKMIATRAAQAADPKQAADMMMAAQKMIAEGATRMNTAKDGNVVRRMTSYVSRNADILRARKRMAVATAPAQQAAPAAAQPTVANPPAQTTPPSSRPTRKKRQIKFKDQTEAPAAAEEAMSVDERIAEIDKFIAQEELNSPQGSDILDQALAEKASLEESRQALARPQAATPQEEGAARAQDARAIAKAADTHARTLQNEALFDLAVAATGAKRNADGKIKADKKVTEMIPMLQTGRATSIFRRSERAAMKAGVSHLANLYTKLGLASEKDWKANIAALSHTERTANQVAESVAQLENMLDSGDLPGFTDWLAGKASGRTTTMIKLETHLIDLNSLFTATAPPAAGTVGEAEYGRIAPGFAQAVKDNNLRVVFNSEEQLRALIRKARKANTFVKGVVFDKIIGRTTGSR